MLRRTRCRLSVVAALVCVTGVITLPAFADSDDNEDNYFSSSSGMFEDRIQVNVATTGPTGQPNESSSSGSGSSGDSAATSRSGDGGGAASHDTVELPDGAHPSTPQ